jgi:RES domain-containing protein
MRLWRLTRAPYTALDGKGSILRPGRWNTAEHPCVYFAADPALTVLEVLVHLEVPRELLPPDYVLGWTDVEATPVRLTYSPIEDSTREMGSRWLKSGKSLLAQTASAILPESAVILMNPRHPDAASVLNLKTRPFSFDDRLL